MHAQETTESGCTRKRIDAPCWVHQVLEKHYTRLTTHALRARGVRARVGVGAGAGPARHRPERRGARRGCSWKSCARPGKAGFPPTTRAPHAAVSLGVTRRALTTRARADGGGPRRRRWRCRCPPAAPLGSFERLKETPGSSLSGSQSPPPAAMRQRVSPHRPTLLLLLARWWRAVRGGDGSARGAREASRREPAPRACNPRRRRRRTTPPAPAPPTHAPVSRPTRCSAPAPRAPRPASAPARRQRGGPRRAPLVAR